ncbi:MULTISPECIES: enoyl-CoA hydratase-related protein [unclassified Novosphingobium]|uniref:enoyl-CoA hydratase-related protein n=1 Tax=unclassified Novosphingobium TaxID=2644732 RepID=UPI0014947914|nr:MULTISPECIES: enoyl-CoA hydratase-related protein [unclassified Novosphingobium]MBB3359988.1 enoyl-CoA hydratase [Novosphingobium sp. BK256]MBB3376347.1 enoyl-CoA hydratase [Novosphingobium sp. BK280]MBB3380772.1 enoyl-CoA hydratase [Novosphingobium sp. BK258]MBB3422412.1 enoyl-CoA hydratase [Novosphingobium sp. BK267]MBB3451123.1 enoyl-CoA hydratase [Novosphingobium sp. BK352]
MTDNSRLLLVDRAPSGVLTLTLNNPEKRNALATPLLALVAEALDTAAGDAAILAVVITGSAKVFAAGADINELIEKGVAGALADPRPANWARIRAFPKPIVAAVEGWCLGAGNELLMCCDLAIAGASARFGQPESNLGIIPGAGGTATLPRVVGRMAAMHMVLLGQPIDAVTAQRLGLVLEVVEDGAALPRATVLAEAIAARAPVAVRQAKSLVNAAFDLPHAAHLGAERQAFSALFGTADKREGIAAFLEKRQPDWTGA